MKLLWLLTTLVLANFADAKPQSPPPEFCPFVIDPVCGSDGVQYSNECLLRYEAYKTNTKITVAKDGPCDLAGGLKSNINDDDEPTQLSNPGLAGLSTSELEQASKNCDTVCSRIFAPVCGSDGNDYDNDCFLEVEKCLSNNPNLMVHSKGYCQHIERPQSEIEKCRNTVRCTRIDRPVCGTDGKTYQNECEVKMKDCLYVTGVEVAFKGHCDHPESSQPDVISDADRGAEILVKRQRSADAQYYPSGVQRSKRQIHFDGDDEPGTGATIVQSGQNRCPQICPANFDPVCGSDGRTYSNRCRFESAKCESSRRLFIVGNGKCRDRNEDCPDACIAQFDPVCGTDGRTYSNDCVLRQVACEERVNIRVKHKGECIDRDQDCNQFCTLDFRPVCGSDGITYSNICNLKTTICNTNNPNLTLKHKGPCKKERGCPEFCTLDFKPVCGTDGVTYSNQCKLQIATCRNNNIQLAYNGPC